MAVFGGMILTNKGLVLQGKAQAGAQLNYTRIAVGDGSLSGQSVPALGALISSKKSLPIKRLQTQSPNKVVIGAVLSNAEVATGFYFREVGVFAQDPDAGEILYAYANAGVTADYIAPGGGSDIIEKLFDCVVVVGTAANITASIDDSLVFALQKDLDTVSAAKVDKVSGKTLSTNDYTTAEKTKLSGIAPGAGSAGTASDTVIGNRTLSDATAPAGDTGTITSLLSGLAYQIKSITGAGWKTASAMTIAAIKTLLDAATSTPAASTLMKRDAAGRAQVAAPSAAADIARKDTVDAAISTAAADASSKASAAQAAAISAAAADAATKANAAQTASIPLAQKGAAGGVAGLDNSANVLGNGFLLGGKHREQVFNFIFANGVANQKVDVYFTIRPLGVIDITVEGEWNNANVVGRITKRISIVTTGVNTINFQESDYIDVIDRMAAAISISNVIWDEGVGMFKVTIESRVSTGNNYTVIVKNIVANGAPAVCGMSSVYTGSATTLPVAVQTIPDNTVTRSGYKIQKHQLTNNDGTAFAVSSGSADTLTTPGDYSIASSAVTGFPLATTGLLEVRGTVQRFTETPSLRAWKRRLNGSTWNAWVEDENASRKNIANGYAGLDVNGDVLLAQIPDAVQKYSLTKDDGKALSLGASGTDLDTVLTTGFYTGNAMINAPAGSTSWFHILVQTHSGVGDGLLYVVQRAINLNVAGTPNEWIRRRVNGTWTAWVSIPNSSYFNVAGGIAGLTSNALLPESILPPSITRRVNLNGQMQVGSYKRSIIALCELTNSNPSANSYSNGILTMHRNNGLYGQLTALISANKRYNTTAMNYTAFRIGTGVTTFRPCTFTYNGVKYGGVDVYIGAAEAHYVEFNGATNFGIFGVDYYDTNTNSALNSEINNSLSSIEDTDFYIFRDINYNGAGINAEKLLGKTLTDVVQGTLAYAVTTGTAAALAASITPAPAALSAGLRLSMKTHVAAAGPVTLNLNGLGAKSIKKPNGNNPSLVLGGVYTLVYDGSVFTLQGEGGEYGTAGAGDVLAGKTVGTESGLVTGTMPNRTNDQITTTMWTDGAGNFSVGFPVGAYITNSGFGAGIASAIIQDADFVANNIPADKNIFGLQGSIPRRGVYTNASSTAWNGTQLYVRIPAGVYQDNGGQGTPEIILSAAQARADGNIIASNIRQGVWMYGVLGTAPSYASETVSATGNFDNITFTSSTVGNNADLIKVTITGTYDSGPGGIQNFSYKCFVPFYSARGRTITVYWEYDYGSGTSIVSTEAQINVSGRIFTIKTPAMPSGNITDGLSYSALKFN